MEYDTADLCDQYADKISIVAPGTMKDFGGKTKFSGVIETVECFEDNSFVRKALEEKGNDKVLVIDGGGSMRCALLGDMLAELAVKNKWRGIVVNGCIRDSHTIGKMLVGVKALAVNPLKSIKKEVGRRNVVVEFHDTRFIPGHWLYADADGIITSPDRLK